MVDEVPRFISLWTESGPLRGKSVNSNPKPPYKGCRRPLLAKNELNSREHPFQPSDISGNSCDFKTESISSAVGKVETVSPLRVLSGRHEKWMVSRKRKKNENKNWGKSKNMKSTHSNWKTFMMNDSQWLGPGISFWRNSHMRPGCLRSNYCLRFWCIRRHVENSIS